jgi:hypothetical protein
MQLLLKFLVPDLKYFSTACRHTCRSCTNAALARPVLASLERLSREANTRLTGTTLHPMYPSLELLRHLGVRFSSMYMDKKWHSCEIVMLQHYILIVDAGRKRVPLLLALLEKCASSGLQGKKPQLNGQSSKPSSKSCSKKHLRSENFHSMLLNRLHQRHGNTDGMENRQLLFSQQIHGPANTRAC